MPAGRHCYVRPNRTKSRPFTCRDIARIIITGIQDGEIERKCVVAVAIRASGYSVAICLALTWITNIDSIEDRHGKAQTLAKLSALLSAIAALLKKTSRVAKIISVVVALLSGLSLFLQVLADILDEIELLDELAELKEIVCDSAAFDDFYKSIEAKYKRIDQVG